VETKGNSLQLPLIMATIKELKPAMDDWVDSTRYEAYEKACKKYGLFIEPDAVFQITSSKNVPLNCIGRKRLTTTKAFGIPYKKGIKAGSIHVFISRTRDNLQKAMLNGWYPLIIKGRLIDRPLADAFKFGYTLGYPSCCIRFFQKFNNWFSYSHLYETFKNTLHKTPHYLSNPLNKNMTYSYIYHIPCSYHCAHTIRWAAQIRDSIRSEEPDFVKLADEHLKKAYLVFYEQKIYAFDGIIKNNRLFYQKAYFMESGGENNIYENDINKGDALLVEGRDVVILKKGRFVKRIPGVAKKFAPETPFIIAFS
jgi:hypothetical protein